MQRRELGTTGLAVTPIGLGLAGLGRPGYVNLGHGDDLPAGRSVEALQARTAQVLDRALELGVGYLDVARSYGRGESFLAAWLARTPEAPVTVGSKWGYTYTADWQVDVDTHEVKDHTLPTFRRQLAETREVLGEHLDLYQVHSATLDSGVLDDVEVLNAMAALAADGVVIGLSTSGPRQAATVERALELAAAGDAPFRVVQSTWNLLEPSVGDALAAAHAAGWGVIVKEGVANGRLTARGDLPPDLVEVARRCGVGADAVALAAALAQPWADVVLSGAVTVEQLESNVGAAEVMLGSDHLDVLAGLQEPAEAYWDRRSSLDWT